MRNQFICDLPESVREHLDREVVEHLDALLDDADLVDEPLDDDVDALWAMRRIAN